MRTIDPANSFLLVVDFQQRLMPVIHDAAKAIANARRLLDGAALFGLPIRFTEQNAAGLGGTVPDLAPADAGEILHKMHFDALREPGLAERLPPAGAAVIAGCEAHVCVLQTVLGLLDRGRPVFVAADAIGSRRAANRDAALARMAAHGAEIVTTEMVLFEWLQTADHPRFREAMKLIK